MPTRWWRYRGFLGTQAARSSNPRCSMSGRLPPSTPSRRGSISVRFTAEISSSARHSHSRHSHRTHPGALDSRRTDAEAYRSCLVANQFRGHRQVGLRVAAGVLWKPRRWPEVRTPQRNPARPGVRRTLARSTRGPDPTPSPCGTSLRLLSDRTVGRRRSTRPLGDMRSAANRRMNSSTTCCKAPALALRAEWRLDLAISRAAIAPHEQALLTHGSAEVRRPTQQTIDRLGSAG
jgi:hypothetical protein